MASVIPRAYLLSEYRDNRYRGDPKALDETLAASTTLYLGNLSFYTTEEQIHQLFSQCGDLARIIVGLDRFLVLFPVERV